MLVFDLSHDRMAAVPFQQVLDVQAAFIFDEDRYLDAGRKIGLTRVELDELERRVSDGQVRRAMLPTQIDAMAGMHDGRVYAVRNVRVRPGQQTFVISLADGKRVYVPLVCGNLSVVRRSAPAIAHATAVHAPARHVAARHVAPARVAAVSAPAAGAGPAAAPLAAGAPAAAAAPATVAVAPAAVAPVVAAAAHHPNLFIPFFAWLTGTIDHTVGGGTAPLPPCTAGRTSDAGGCVSGP